MDCPLKRLPGIWEILARATKTNIAYNFCLAGPGVPPIIERTSEMKSSDDLRSELYTTFWDGLGEKLWLVKVRKADGYYSYVYSYFR